MIKVGDTVSIKGFNPQRKMFKVERINPENGVDVILRSTKFEQIGYIIRTTIDELVKCDKIYSFNINFS